MPAAILIARLSALDTNILSDALDRLELPGAASNLWSLWGCQRLVGRAPTVQLRRAGADEVIPSGHYLMADALDTDEGEGRVLVVAGGVDGVACWDEILANAAHAQGFVGSVVDGLSRDVDGIEAVAYPVFCQGTALVSGNNRLVQAASGVPVRVGGVLVRDGDYVVADRGGVVFIAASCIEEVIVLGEQLARRQDGILASLRAGRSLGVVMRDASIGSRRAS